MTMSAHNDAGPVCHIDCCGGPVDSCYCWMCSPDTFPWGQFGSVEDAAANWDEWYSGNARPEPPQVDETDEAIRQAEYGRAMSAWYGRSGRQVMKGKGR